MTFDAPLFNLHDLTLLFAVSQYLLLSVFLFLTRRARDKSMVFLILILLVNALESADTFITWSEPVRNIVLNWHPSLLFWGALGFWLQGPLLYWYVSSVLYSDFKFSRIQLLHLVPAAIVLLILYFNYYAFGRAEQLELMQNLQLMWGNTMVNLVTFRYLSIIFYGVWCLFTLYRYRSEVRQQYAGYSASERPWLLWVVVGVVTLSAWSLMVHLIGNNINAQTSNVLGVMSNYLTFIFVNSLVFLSIRYSALFDGLSSQLPADDDDTDKEKELNPEYIERIEHFMTKEQPYLLNDIHIELLAKQLSMTPRTLSHIINRHFKMNFFEFINTHRITEAKRILADPEKADKTVLEIMHETGFGSKSSFNATFKQHVKMTPSEYRRKTREQHP